MVLFLNCHETSVQHLNEMCHVTATNTREREVTGVSCLQETLRGMTNHVEGGICHNICFHIPPCKALCDLKDVIVIKFEKSGNEMLNNEMMFTRIAIHKITNFLL